MKGPVAMMMIPAMDRTQKSMLHLYMRTTLGNSMKKLVRVTSFAVAPHCGRH